MPSYILAAFQLPGCFTLAHYRLCFSKEKLFAKEECIGVYLFLIAYVHYIYSPRNWPQASTELGKCNPAGLEGVNATDLSIKLASEWVGGGNMLSLSSTHCLQCTET